MKLNYIRLFYICLLSNLFLIYSMPMITLGAESRIVIGEDDIDDLRNFEGDWLVDEIEKEWWNFEKTDLGKTYDKLERHWDDEEACEPLYNPDVDGPDNTNEYKDYTDYTYIDIFKIEVRDLDKDVATMVIRVKGDAEDSDNPWVLFLWSDCDDDDTVDIFFIAIHAPDGIGGSDVDGYIVEQGSYNESGNIDYNDEGSDIEMDFDPDSWTDVKECNIYAIMITPKSDNWDEDSEPDVIVELFPKGEYSILLDFWFWFWLILVCLVVLVVCVLVYYWYKKRNGKIGLKKRV